MAKTLKGQNARICVQNADGKMECIALATSCTVNLTANTDDVTTKDDVGMSSKPEVTSKGWQMSVETLKSADVGRLMADMKAGYKFFIVFEQTSTDDNQSLEETDSKFTYLHGQAYLTDMTVNFNDRENTAKSLQFSGTGELSAAQDQEVETYEVLSPSSYTKGQYVRLFLSSDNTTTPVKVLAAPRSLSLHVSVSLETTTTKDTTGDWVVQEPTGISYDISTTALVYSGEAITSQTLAMTFNDLRAIWVGSTPVKWQIANVSGANNRTKGAVIVSGSAVLTGLNVTAQNRQAVQFDASFNGWGDYTVGS